MVFRARYLISNCDFWIFFDKIRSKIMFFAWNSRWKRYSINMTPRRKVSWIKTSLLELCFRPLGDPSAFPSRLETKFLDFDTIFFILASFWFVFCYFFKIVTRLMKEVRLWTLTKCGACGWQVWEKCHHEISPKFTKLTEILQKNHVSSNKIIILC